jgi:ABC-type glycerol-3-phosphate transport system substrate-binding protein
VPPSRTTPASPARRSPSIASIRDTEEDLLKQSWKDFENCTGVKIEYEGSGEFETQIKVRVDGGRAPDIAFVPQPGVVEYFAKGGKLKGLGARPRPRPPRTTRPTG